MRIWDIHCHLPSKRVAGESFQAQAESLMEIGSRLGIDGFGLFIRTGKSTEYDADIRRTLEKYPKNLFGFVWCSLNNPTESERNLRQWVGDGPMIGLKLGGGSGVCSRPEYDPTFQVAMEVKAVIYQHTWMKIGSGGTNDIHDRKHAGETADWYGGGNFEGESMPQDLVAVARRYPDYPFICGHSGGDWQQGIRAARDTPNVLVEFGGGYPTSGQVDMIVREVGAERAIYGSDVTGRSFATQVAKLFAADVSESERSLIASGNFHRLMKPVLDAKGITISS